MIDFLRFFRSAPNEDPVLRTATAAYAVQVALSELGHGETTGQNAGPDIERYRYGVSGPIIGGPKDPWCASFVCFCFEFGWLKFQGLSEPAAPFPIKRTSSALKLWTRVGEYGAFVTTPQIGDLALWKRPGGHHVDLVVKFDTGIFVTVDGNKGIFPSKVRTYPHEYGEHWFLGFARFP